jgi:hypothetical protein
VRFLCSSGRRHYGGSRRAGSQNAAKARLSAGYQVIVKVSGMCQVKKKIGLSAED